MYLLEYTGQHLLQTKKTPKDIQPRISSTTNINSCKAIFKVVMPQWLTKMGAG